jgi:hypothetical protein
LPPDRPDAAALSSRFASNRVDLLVLHDYPSELVDNLRRLYGARLAIRRMARRSSLVGVESVERGEHRGVVVRPHTQAMTNFKWQTLGLGG